MKRENPTIKKLKSENADLNKALNEKDATASYWMRRAQDAEARFQKGQTTNDQMAGLSMNRNSVIETSVQRAFVELHSVQPNEINVASLQRVIGSAQGALSLALENTGRMQCDHIDLSPKDKGDDKLHEIARVLRRDY